MKSQKFSFYPSQGDSQTLDNIGYSPATHPIALSHIEEKKGDADAHQFLTYLLVADTISADTKKKIQELLSQATRLSCQDILKSLYEYAKNDIPAPVVVDASIPGLPNPIPVTAQIDNKTLLEKIPAEMSGIHALGALGLIQFGLQSINPTKLTPYISEHSLRRELQQNYGNSQQQKTTQRVLADIITRTMTTLNDQPPTLENWNQALLDCPDKDFMFNLSAFAHGRIYSGSIYEDLIKFDDQVLLRYHELNSGAYRGDQTGGNLWVGNAESTIKCGVCRHAISGPQNRVRDAGYELHASCVPEHLEKKKREWGPHDHYMARVHNVMFPRSQKITPCGK